MQYWQKVTRGAALGVVSAALACASADGPDIKADAGRRGTSPAERREREVRAVQAAVQEVLATAENVQRTNTLLSYVPGAATEEEFWADGWNALDPVEGEIGVVGLTRGSSNPPETTCILGVAHPASLEDSEAYVGPGFRDFLRTVAMDRQNLLTNVLAGKPVDLDMLPPPLSFRVSEADGAVVWEPSSHDIPLYEATFRHGTLVRVDPLF